MAILPIYNCFHQVLKQKTNPIPNVTDEIKTLITDMFDTMKHTDNGVGLAANQVGKDIALFVVDLSDVDEYKEKGECVFINPEIIEYSDETDYYNEGCLSIPGFYEDVERPISVKIRYCDSEMNEFIEEYSGFIARVIQHEYDHLQGIMFYDRLSHFKRTLSRSKIHKIQIGNYESHYDMINADGVLHKANQ